MSGPPPPPFDGYTEWLCRVTSQFLVHLERNRYSVPCSRIGQAARIRIHADRQQVVAEGELLAEHPRQFALPDAPRFVALRPGTGKEARCPAQRCPFVDWALPRPIKTVQARLLKLRRALEEGAGK